MRCSASTAPSAVSTLESAEKTAIAPPMKSADRQLVRRASGRTCSSAAEAGGGAACAARAACAPCPRQRTPLHTAASRWIP